MTHDFAIYITEVFPNPKTGSEWVEIYCLAENLSSQDLVTFTMHDDKQIIYTFDGEEVWQNQTAIIEVSGLNNDGDSVILKNEVEDIIDQMSYNSSTKDQSWSRLGLNNQEFALTEPNPGQFVETSITPSITPSLTASPTATITDKPSSTPTPSLALTPSPTTTEAAPTTSSTPTFNCPVLFPNYQDQKLKLSYGKDHQAKQATRLVLLGQKIPKKPATDAIIGGSLLLIAAWLLSLKQQDENKTT